VATDVKPEVLKMGQTPPPHIDLPLPVPIHPSQLLNPINDNEQDFQDKSEKTLDSSVVSKTLSPMFSEDSASSGKDESSNILQFNNNLSPDLGIIQSQKDEVSPNGNLKSVPTGKNSPVPVSNNNKATTSSNGGGYFSIPVKKNGNTSGKTTPQTLHSAASLARLSRQSGLSPPITTKSTSTTQTSNNQQSYTYTSFNTSGNLGNPQAAFKKGHKKMSSLSSLTSLGGLRKASGSKTSILNQEHENLAKLSSNGSKVDIFKSLYE